MKSIVGATAAQVRQETGLKHHPTFNELVAQYQEGGPKIPWNDDPEIILRSPAVAELAGMAAVADDRIRDRMALAQRNYYIKQEAQKQGLDFYTVRHHMDNVAPWADHDHPMHDDEWMDQEAPPPPPPGFNPFNGAERYNIGTPRENRRDHAAGMDALYAQQLRQQAAQAQQHSAATNRWLEQLLLNVEHMGRRHDEQLRAMNELSARQNTFFDALGRRMGEARQSVEQTERQRAQMEEQRFRTLLEHVGRLASKQGEQNHNVEMMRLLQQYLSEHAQKQQAAASSSASASASATTSALSDRLGAIEASLQGMGQRVAQGSQGVIAELKQALAEHREAQRSDLATASAMASTATNLSHRLLTERLDTMQQDMRAGISAGLQQQEQARQAMKESSAAVLKGFQTLNENIMGVGIETVQLLSETKDAVAATQAGVDTMNSQQQQQAAAAEALAQQQEVINRGILQGHAMQSQAREEFYAAMGQLSQQHHTILAGLMAVLQNPQVIQMNQVNQLQVLQQVLGENLSQIQREVLLALASNRPVAPESLTYLLQHLDGSETSQLLKAAAIAQQSQLALEDLKMPEAEPPTAAQTPGSSSGLGPRLPDGSRPDLGIMRAADAAGLRPGSSPASSSSQVPTLVAPQRGRERPSVSQSRDYAKHTAAALKGDVSLEEARSRSMHDRNKHIVTRAVRRGRSTEEDTMQTEDEKDTAKKPRPTRAPSRVPSLPRPSKAPL